MQDFHLPWELSLLCLAFYAYVLFKPRNRRRRYKRNHKRRYSFGLYKQKPAAGVEWSGFVDARVVRVVDGDTVIVKMQGGKMRGLKVRIRLDAIDCPEDGQPWGDIATFGLKKLIGGKMVRLEGHGLDQYSRSLATIFVKNDFSPKYMNVNEQMVTLGHAWVMRQCYTHLSRARQSSLNRLETLAKTRKAGLWNTIRPMPPWQWRVANRDLKL